MKKPFIVAEIAQGYEGSEKLVELYIKAAVAAGADAVKFQIFFADELALPDYKYYDLFKGLELPATVWEKAVTAAHQKKLEFYSDVFGPDSLAMLEKAGVDGYKVHTTDINNRHLLQLIAGTGKEVFLSTGGCEETEIGAALDILNANNVTLLYGFQAEPTELVDNNLNRIAHLIRKFNRPVGFQDHTAGNSEFAYSLPFIAVGAGAELIEKHLTLSRAAEIEDCISALTPEEFARWAAAIKTAYESLGKSQWDLTTKEREYRGKVRRAVCTVKTVARDAVISLNDLTLKRTDQQDAIHDLAEVIGKTAARQLDINIPVRKGDFR